MLRGRQTTRRHTKKKPTSEEIVWRASPVQLTGLSIDELMFPLRNWCNSLDQVIQEFSFGKLAANASFSYSALCTADTSAPLSAHTELDRNSNDLPMFIWGRSSSNVCFWVEKWVVQIERSTWDSSCRKRQSKDDSVSFQNEFSLWATF